MMSHVFQNDGDSCSVIFVLFIMNIVNEVIQQKFTVSGENFYIRVI
jgi:hypothetical protein